MMHETSNRRHSQLIALHGMTLGEGVLCVLMNVTVLKTPLKTKESRALIYRRARFN